MNLIIQKQFVGKTILEFLSFYQVSKAKIYHIRLRKGSFVNGECAKLEYVLQENDYLSFDEDTIGASPISKKDIEVVYEDDDVLIVNKPPALLIHSDGVATDTLTSRVLFYSIQKGFHTSLQAVHRLDYETSGLVVFAKNFITLAYLSYLFAERKVKKIYSCISLHRFDSLQGTIEAKIGKDRHSEKQMVLKSGKMATTKYRVVRQKANEAKVLVEIIEGRKHQIRVHMAYIHHPIKGDKLYGKPTNSRMYLHCRQISFVHPRSLDECSYTCGEDF